MRPSRGTVVRLVVAASLLLLVPLATVSLLWPWIVKRAAFQAHALDPRYLDPEVWRFTGESVHLVASDSTRLHGWWLPAPGDGGCGAVLFLHGNAGNLSSQAGFAGAFHRHGLDVLVVDYRGYGASEGRASEQGLYLDAAAAYAYLRQERGVPPREILLAGHSLGTAVATELATGAPVAGMILAAPFSSFPAAMRARLPWFPVALLRWPRERFEAVARAPAVHAPVLAVSSERDPFIALEDARAYVRALPGPKQWVITRSGHNELLYDQRFQEALGPWLDGVLRCRQRA